MKNLIIPAMTLLMVLLALSACEKDEFIFPKFEYQTEITPLSNDQAERVTMRHKAVMPFDGSYITYPEMVGPLVDGIITLHIPAEGNATQLGKSTWEAWQKVDISNPYNQTISGTFTLTAANGDQLSGWYDGKGTINEEDLIVFSGKMYVDARGNTGQFECVTGQLPYYGKASFEQGELFFEDGILIKENKGCTDDF